MGKNLEYYEKKVDSCFSRVEMQHIGIRRMVILDIFNISYFSTIVYGSYILLVQYVGPGCSIRLKLAP